MKQETLEEAAQNYSVTFIEDDGTAEVDFIAGAKWQAERMYSEEEVENILFRYAEEEHAWFSCKSEIDSFNEWLKQFKKK
jgi:hypothetical protein